MQTIGRRVSFPAAAVPVNRVAGGAVVLLFVGVSQVKKNHWIVKVSTGSPPFELIAGATAAAVIDYRLQATAVTPLTVSLSTEDGRIET